MHRQLNAFNILEANSINRNLQSIFSEKEETILNQERILAGVADAVERRELREGLKCGYTSEVVSLNSLLDKSLDGMISLTNGLEMNASKRYESQSTVGDQVNWLIEQHSRNIERIKETLSVYSI